MKTKVAVAVAVCECEGQPLLYIKYNGEWEMAASLTNIGATYDETKYPRIFREEELLKVR